jgi:hypothetical protein
MSTQLHLRGSGRRFGVARKVALLALLAALGSLLLAASPALAQG